MSSNNGVFSNLIASIGGVFEELTGNFESASTISSLIYYLGWKAEINDKQIPLIKTYLCIDPLVNDINQIINDYESSSDDQEIISIVQKIISKIPEILIAINSIENSNSNGLPYPFSENEFKQQWKDEVFDLIVCQNLISNNSDLFYILYGIGLIDNIHIIPTDNQRIEYDKYIINWGGIIDFITGPLNYLKGAYNWGDNIQPFNYNKFFDVITYLSWRISSYSPLLTASGDVKLPYYDNNPPYDTLPILLFNFLSDLDPDLSIGFTIIPIPGKDNNNAVIRNSVPVGFNISPFVNDSVSEEILLSDTIKIKISGGFNSEGGISYELRPTGNHLAIYDYQLTIDGKLGIAYKPTEPLYLMGSKGDKTFLNVEGLWGAIELKETTVGGEPEFILEIGTSEKLDPTDPKINLSLDLSEGDGFIAKIFKNVKAINNSFGGKIIYSSKRGLMFNGQVNTKITIPLDNRKIGPVELHELVIGFTIGNKPGIYAGLSAAAKISAVTAEVSEMGVKLNLVDTTGTDRKAILGNYNIEFGFKPPDGIGLSIESDAVTGGGFLFLDYDAGRYGGALSLKLSKLSLDALGLLCTKLPNNRKGFSLLVIISIEFATPIQISFGFTLNKVGGLLGLNREMESDNIRSGVRNGSMTKVLFPENPTEHAMELLSSLESYFPTSEKETFIIGPMLEIGWGEPTLITLDLMLLIQINPLDFGIAGLLHCILPKPEDALLCLQVAFLGELNPGKKFLKFDAAIFDSKLLFLTLSGGMAVRMFWGDHGGFIISVGGFHPNYVIPPEMELCPAPDRMKISIIDDEHIKINVQNYFAVTSNTVQFGTNFSLWVKEGNFKVTGSLGFDALIYFKPTFSFIIGINASVTVYWGHNELMGIALSFNLSGPKPWRAWGTGTVHCLGHHSVDFDHTFGDNQTESHEMIEVYNQFYITELEKPSNWKIVEGTSSGQLVTLRKMGDDEMIITPTSVLQITQRAVPMGVTIDKFGNKEIADILKKYDIISIDLEYEDDHIASAQTEEIRDQFAPGEFFNLSTDDNIENKTQSFLKAPNFQEYKSGISLKPFPVDNNGLDLEYARRKQLSPHLIIVDSILPEPIHQDPGNEYTYHFEKSLWENSACQCSLSPFIDGGRPYSPATNVQSNFDSYVIVSTTNLGRLDENTTYRTQAEADQGLKDKIKGNTVKQGDYMTMNLCEVN